MATIFESRPRAASPTPVPPPKVEDDRDISGAIAALEAAARELLEVTTSYPLARRRAAEMLVFHARRLGRLSAIPEDDA